MNWYLAKLVFRILCGDGKHTAQFDEQLRLILAGSKEEAFHKAQAIGKNDEEMFFNHKGPVSAMAIYQHQRTLSIAGPN